MHKVLADLASKSVLWLCLLTLAACGGGGGAGNPVAASDLDGDGIVDTLDNCPNVSNPGQLDTDGDGLGDVCDATPRPLVFNWSGNTRLTAFSLNGLLAGAPAGTRITSFDATSLLGGSVSVDQTSGAFSYDPPVGAQNVADRFSFATSASDTATVTINLSERIWFVRNNDGGSDQGTFLAPFKTLAQAEAAADADDTIFVFTGDGLETGQDLGIALQSGQRLLGEGVGLKLNGIPLIDPRPARPRLSNAALGGAAGDTPVIRLGDRNEVAGFILTAAFNDGILASSGGDYLLHDNAIGFGPGGRSGIRLLSVGGDNRLLRNAVTSPRRDGIKLANTEDIAGNPVTPTAMSAGISLAGNSISNAAQNGIACELSGSGSQLALHLLTNTITSPGRSGAFPGIDLHTLDNATIKVALSRNSVSDSPQQAIDLSAAGSAALAAFVAHNRLDNSLQSDLRVQIPAAGIAEACVELIDNHNTAGTTSFLMENSGAAGSLFDLFESQNDTLANRVGAIGAIPQNACGIPFNGAMLFEANCGICHAGNGLGGGNFGPNLTNATPAMILFQLANNPSMTSIKLTGEEVQAISAALAKP